VRSIIRYLKVLRCYLPSVSKGRRSVPPPQLPSRGDLVRTVQEMMVRTHVRGLHKSLQRQRGNPTSSGNQPPIISRVGAIERD
jgi:hypothetical protein